jgi:hypothetical protein
MTRIPRGAAVRLPPRARNALLSIHIAATVSALGADLVLLALDLAGLLGSDPRTVYPAAYLIGSSIMAPLAVVSLATGLSLALLTSWGVFRYWWVTIKLTITAVLTVLVLLVLVPRLGSAARAVGAGVALTDAERLQLVLTPATGSGLLIGMIALAVFKPSWRLPRRMQRGRVTAPGR